MNDATRRGIETFPVDRPVEALIRDHNLVRKLVDIYRRSDNATVKIKTAEQILRLMESHSLLEEKAFYPAVREIDPSLVGHFEQEHFKGDELLVSIKRMSLNDPEAFPMFERVIEMHMHHIDEEESQFFPKLERSGLDMTPIGLQMRTYEADLVHTQAMASERLDTVTR